MTQEKPARDAPFIVCPHCRNTLGQRRKDGAVESKHAKRRWVFREPVEITCEQCHLTMVFSVA